MLTTLLAALEDAESDRTCRALLLTGEGRGFCAGQELGPQGMSCTDDGFSTAMNTLSKTCSV